MESSEIESYVTTWLDDRQQVHLQVPILPTCQQWSPPAYRLVRSSLKRPGPLHRIIPPTTCLRTRTINTNISTSRLRLGIHHISIIHLSAEQGESMNNNGGDGDDDKSDNGAILHTGPC